MEFVHNGPVMVWEEKTGQYVSPATGGVLPPATAAAYFRGMLDGLVRNLTKRLYIFCSRAFPNANYAIGDGFLLESLRRFTLGGEGGVSVVFARTTRTSCARRCATWLVFHARIDLRRRHFPGS